MSYTRPDHDAADASWSGESAYTRPDAAAADASWEESASGPVGSIAATLRYSGNLLGHHGQAVVGTLAATMRYSASVLGVHAPPVVGGIEARMRYAAQIAGTHDGPPAIVFRDDTVAAYIYIAEFTVARNWTGFPLEVYRFTNAAGGMTLGPEDTPAGQFVRPGLLDPGWMRREMASGASMLGASRASFGAAVLANVDGALDWLDDCGVDGREYTLYIGEAGDVFPDDYDVLFKAVMVNKVVGAERVEIQFRGYEELLDVPICSARFAGTGELEGGSELTNKPKPRYYDYNPAVRSAKGDFNALNPYVMEPIEQRPPPAIPVVLLDEALQLYWVCENPTQRVSTSDKWNVALDGGFPYAGNNEYNNFETFMNPAEPPAGMAGFWRGASGPMLMRLGTKPVFSPSVIPGHGRSMSGKSPTFKNIVADELGLTIAPHSDAADFFGYYSGETTYLQAMSDLAPAQGVFFGFDRLGRFFVRQLRDPSESAPSFVLDRTRFVTPGPRKQTPTTAPLPVSAVTFRGYKNHMYGQQLAPAVFEEDYPDYQDSGTDIQPGTADLRVVVVLHWLLKQYATDATSLPPPPAAPPLPPAPAPPAPPAPAVVDILVEDQFSGAGPVNSHPHDQAMYGHAWSGTSGYALSGGDLEGAAGDPGVAYAITVPTDPIDFSQKMVLVVGEWVAPADGPTGLLLQVDVLDDEGAALPGRSLKLIGTGSGSSAVLNLTGSSPAGDLDVVYAPGQSHPFTLRLGDTYSTISMAGGTFPSLAVAGSLTSPPDEVTYGGVRLLLGHGSSMRSLYVQRIHADAPAEPTPSPWPPVPPGEGVVFLDTFQGESTLAGHTPDYAAYGHAWAEQPLLTVDGGQLLTIGAEEGGAFVATPSTAPDIALAGLQLTWAWRAPDPLPSWHPLDPVATLPMVMLSLDAATEQESDVDGAGVPLPLSGDGLGLFFKLLPRRDNATGPYLLFGDQVEQVAVTPGTLYEGSLSITESGMTLEFLGETIEYVGDATGAFNVVRGAMWWGGALELLQVAAVSAAPSGTPVVVDSFSGSGDIGSHVPEVAEYGISWSNGFPPLSIAAGRCVVQSPYTTGRAVLITEDSPSGLPAAGLIVRWSWRAPAVLPNAAVTLLDLRLYGTATVDVGRVTITRSAGDGDGITTLHFPTLGDSMAATVVPGEDYLGWMVIASDGTSTLSFLGQLVEVSASTAVEFWNLALELYADGSLDFLEIDQPEV